jgi:N-acetylglucosaminyldiphosphoundecaprenol N-acetyl-beta-D-mannosaminyltransferase
VIRRIPIACNVLRGDMSIVGPRATAPGELSPRERQARRRYDVRPGVVCLWWVRKRANIAYESEAALDREYVESHGAMKDVSIALRAIPAALYGESSPVELSDEVNILGIRTHNLTMAEAIDWIVARLGGSAASQICFVNPDCANIALRHPGYRQTLDRAALVLADGIGIKIAGKLLGTPIRQNVNGTDLFPRLMQAMGSTEFSVYLLGARPGVPDLVAEWIRKEAPGVRIAGIRHGYFDPEEAGGVAAEIRASGASLLLVAFGAPRQDLWIAERLGETGVKVAMGVGGLFDFYSGRIPRAPVWMREIGMEWLYRFLQEPRRMWRRYFVGNAVFLFHVWRQKRRVRRGLESAA